MKREQWLALVLQSLLFLGAAWGYAASQEHRFTVLEEASRTQAQIIQQLASQVQDIQRTQDRLVALEEFIHKKR